MAVARTNELITPIPGRLEKALKEQLNAHEEILVRLKGAYKEALICTSTRVVIVKAGFYTGNFFGSDTFQMPYTNVAGAQVNKHLLTGYFEISAGGMQNTPKSFWQNDRSSPQRAPNCISLTRSQFGVFTSAANFIMSHAHEVRVSSSAGTSLPREDAAGLLEKLAKLRDQGVLSEAEFVAKKADILAKI